jgi:hypothetical protein
MMCRLAIEKDPTLLPCDFALGDTYRLHTYVGPLHVEIQVLCSVLHQLRLFEEAAAPAADAYAIREHVHQPRLRVLRREHARTISQLAQVPTKASSVRVVRTQIVHTSIEDHDIEISSQPRALKVPD